MRLVAVLPEPLPKSALVYSVPVAGFSQDVPVAHERPRRWATADDAAEMVNELEPKSILRAPCVFPARQYDVISFAAKRRP